MAKILITSGPTRQYLDPVRYLTNASSGQMGAALAKAAIEFEHEVLIVSGPVMVDYPSEARVIPIVTTQELLEVCQREFADCDGAIGAAAPCDYQPRQVQTEKIMKTGLPIILELIETPDVIATLGQRKRPGQWLVGFALETDDRHFRSIVKLQKKHCDLMVNNGPEAINSSRNQIELIEPTGTVLERIEGDKLTVALQIMRWINKRLIRQPITNQKM
jgi:phosphopantothenoylcysteine decarboxylase/phosphopantothenate--cysteine ligase